MQRIVCRNCGAEIPAARASCPACGASREHTGSPAGWEPPATRRVAFLAGILLALLILAALAWRLADSRRSPLEAPAPILPIGGGDR
ncbi:MAG TPA: zinc-ribbon domain-containing protein [Longimicrobiaceae bacterium]|nr:zinc-ribbon domain-containing protein [Longimicrobiaceae bacterium]